MRRSLDRWLRLSNVALLGSCATYSSRSPTSGALDISFIDLDAQARARKLGSAFARGEPVAERIAAEMSTYKFYHDIEVIPGVRTHTLESPQVFQNAFYEAAQTINLKKKRVLDAGCRDGAMLFFAEEQGASELVGVDNDPSLGMTNFLIPFRGSKVKSYGANVYDLRPEDLGKFDIVIACGLLYHLRYPMLGVKRLADMLVEDGMLILETAILDAFYDFPILFYPSRARQSPFEESSPSFFNLACLSNSFQQAALSTPRVSMSFDPTAAFPQFSRAAGLPMTITRTIVMAERKARTEDSLERYFEGRHQFHSTNVW